MRAERLLGQADVMVPAPLVVPKEVPPRPHAAACDGAHALLEPGDRRLVRLHKLLHFGVGLTGVQRCVDLVE